MVSAADRFWRKVAKSDGCWLWTGSVSSYGYGKFWDGSGLVSAHRFAYGLTAPIPSGLCVLHRCDNPRCVRVEHLFLGTFADNTADMFAKGRGREARGEKSSSAVLTEEAVRAIRRARARGESQAALARRYGVTPTTISYAVNRKTWAHVDDAYEGDCAFGDDA